LGGLFSSMDHWREVVLCLQAARLLLSRGTSSEQLRENISAGLACRYTGKVLWIVDTQSDPDGHAQTCKSDLVQ